jgi:hypothetical protein
LGLLGFAMPAGKIGKVQSAYVPLKTILTDPNMPIPSQDADIYLRTPEN